MNWYNVVGVVLLLGGLVGGLFVLSSYLESRGFCVLVCDWSEEIASSRARAEAAEERAEVAEERVDVLERERAGLSPAFLFVVVALAVLAFLYNEISDGGAQNITLRQAEERAAEYMERVHGYRRGVDYVRVVSMAGQVVPGSKDSYLYAVGFVKQWGATPYPVDWQCVTVYMLSTDPERCTGVVWGITPRSFHDWAKMRIQKTPNASDLAQSLDRALTERKLADAVEEIGGGPE